MDRGGWWATVYGIAESDTIEKLALVIYYHKTFVKYEILSSKMHLAHIRNCMPLCPVGFWKTSQSK